MTVHDTQSFFTPDEFFCLNSKLLSSTYNLANILLKRSQSKHLFIPIRPLQYLAIIEKDVFWFVDSFAYAVKGDEGGRLIRISWRPQTKNVKRDSLAQHINCRVLFYGDDMSDIQNRLNKEFYQAMLLIDQRHRDSLAANYKVNIVSLKPVT